MNPCVLNCSMYFGNDIYSTSLCRLILLKMKYPFCKQQSSFLTRSTQCPHVSATCNIPTASEQVLTRCVPQSGGQWGAGGTGFNKNPFY